MLRKPFCIGNPPADNTELYSPLFMPCHGVLSIFRFSYHRLDVEQMPLRISRLYFSSIDRSAELKIRNYFGASCPFTHLYCELL